MAFIGVRSCDLHAIAKLDRVFLGGRYVNPEYERRRGRVFVVAVNCGVAAVDVLLRLDGHRAEGDLRLRRRADRAARRRRAALPRRGGHRARRGAPRRAARARSHRGGGRGRRARSSSTRRPRWAGTLDTEGLPELLAAQPRASALGRGRRALPDLRELHDGLPHLLLHDGRGRHRPHRRGGRAAPGLGLLLHDGLHVPPRRRRAHVDASALPPLAHPQARHLARPVRQLRAAWAAAGASPGARSAIDITEEAAALREERP